MPQQIALALLATFISSAASAEVQTRTLNDGNLVLQDIPEIPSEVYDGLRRYRNTRGASLAGWSGDGDSLYFTTRFADVSQLHRIDMPGGARHQLTFLEEPVSSVNVVPDGSLTFQMDTGGDEFDQIYRFDPATADIRRLSDGGRSRNGAVEFTRDGTQMAFQSTRRNGASNDVWVTPLADPTQARVLLEAPDGAWWGPSTFSPDGSRLLVTQYISVADARIHLVDVASGQRTLLAGDPELASANFPYAFDAHGTGYYFTSNEDGEFHRLYHQRFDNDSATLITGDIDWDVTDLVASNDGRRIAFTANQAGLSALYLLDPADHSYRRVDGLPAGLLGRLRFDPAGRRLAMTLNTATTPSDLFVLHLKAESTGHGQLERWTFSEVGGLDTTTFVEPSLIEYPTFDEVDGKPRMISAFFYQPKTDGPHPVLVSIHGGPEGQFRPSFRATYQYWANELGIAIIAPNVRGSRGYGKTFLTLDNGFKREDSVRDIGALLDWIGTQESLDADRVVAYGGSYGGYMVLASAVHYSDRLRAAIDMVGISNFVTFLENTEDYRRDLRRVEYGDERDPAMRAHLEQISPLNHVDKIDVPLFVGQGQNDPRVPVTEAEQIVAALRAKGQTVWYMNALNEGHGFGRKENQDEYIAAISLFLKRMLL